MYNKSLNLEFFNNLSKGHFPGMMGIEITHIEEGSMEAEMEIKKEFFAPNGFLHAGSIATFADTIAGYSAVAHLPEGGKMFTTLEFKCNFIGAAREGKLKGKCIAEHLGKKTQVWRVVVTDMNTQKEVAIFSCTQIILY